jgi:hypothetical protein
MDLCGDRTEHPFSSALHFVAPSLPLATPCRSRFEPGVQCLMRMAIRELVYGRLKQHVDYSM